MKVCVAAHSGRGGLVPLGSICAPQCPAGFVNTSIFCPKVPAPLLLPLPCPCPLPPDRPAAGTSGHHGGGSGLSLPPEPAQAQR